MIIQFVLISLLWSQWLRHNLHQLVVRCIKVASPSENFGGPSSAPSFEGTGSAETSPGNLGAHKGWNELELSQEPLDEPFSPHEGSHEGSGKA